MPVINNFLPTGGTMGSTVTITGTNFNTNAKSNIVMVNYLQATVVNATSTQLDIIVPEGATSGKISISVNNLTATSTEDFKVLDFNNLTIRGLYVLFERRGYNNGYGCGQCIQEFNNLDPVVGHTVKEEVALQLDEMKKIGVNSITYELRSADSILIPGGFEPPECNMPPGLGFKYPKPTSQEITNLVDFFDLVYSKQIKILLRLVNTHMEEQPPTNNTIWLQTILNAIKNHPALELVLFEGDTHLVDNDGDGVGDACGNPAEPPLWLGPSSKPANYVRWAIQYGLSIGIPANKLSAQAVVGDYFVNTSPPAGPSATEFHLWPAIGVLKEIFDDLSIPQDQRTYAISFYEHRECANITRIPCINNIPNTWAEETLTDIFNVIGRKGSRVIAVEMGLQSADPNWSTEQAFESLFLLMKRYGVSGGCFWRWSFFSDDENNDHTLSTPVKKRGVSFSYNPVKDKIAQYYLAN